MTCLRQSESGSGARSAVAVIGRAAGLGRGAARTGTDSWRSQLCLFGRRRSARVGAGWGGQAIT